MQKYPPKISKNIERLKISSKESFLALAVPVLTTNTFRDLITPRTFDIDGNLMHKWGV